MLGYARLSEIELLISKRIRTYLLKLFEEDKTMNIEIDPAKCARYLRQKDYVGINFGNIDESIKKLNESFIFESPHVELEDEYGDLRFWDFCAEEDFHNLENGGWLKQLLTLYTPPHIIKSLNPIKNNPKTLKISEDELPLITNSLLNNKFFINIAKNDLKNVSAKFNLELKNTIPNILYAKIN